MITTTPRRAFVAALALAAFPALWATAEETRVTFPDLDALIQFGLRLWGAEP